MSSAYLETQDNNAPTGVAVNQKFALTNQERKKRRKKKKKMNTFIKTGQNNAHFQHLSFLHNDKLTQTFHLFGTLLIALSFFKVYQPGANILTV